MQLYKPLSSGATVNIFDKNRVGPGRQDASECDGVFKKVICVRTNLTKKESCLYEGEFVPIRGK